MRQLSVSFFLLLFSCATSTAPKTETQSQMAKRIVDYYAQNHQAVENGREIASVSLAQNHYALLSRDEHFNKVLEAQASQHFEPILFAQNPDQKLGCNCFQYALFFRNGESHEARMSLVIVEQKEEFTKVRSFGDVAAIPSDEGGVATKKFLASLSEFSTSD